ncbi:zinc finger protein ZXDC [Electrophorus electricus]|nr:zinc finger protein ZXDC [Electrophorus electricus]
MSCCYRDTKMEIQGLADAQNTHYQHGAPRKSALSPLGTTTETISSSILKENDNADHSESHVLQSDNNNNRPRSSLLRLLAENGSGSCLSLCHKQNERHSTLSQKVQVANVELCNLNTLKEKDYLELSPEFVRGELKYTEENEDSVLQMALPLFDGEDGYAEHSEQRQLLAEDLRQRHQDSPSLPVVRASCSNASDGTIGPSIGKNSEEFYVVLNIVQENGLGDNKERQTRQSEEGEKVNGKKADSARSTYGPVDVQHRNLTIKAKSSSVCSFGHVGVSSDLTGETGTVVSGRQRVCFEAENGSIVLSDASVESGHDGNQKMSDVMMACNNLVSMEQASRELNECDSKDGTAVLPESTDTPETTDMTEANNSTEYITDYVNLGTNNDSVPDGTSETAHETFSGTIMINNQSIIVTIENGVLTLAAPPEGYSYKEDGLVSLKEHLGMKDHEDIVLLNYDSGTKSIGKISNVAGSTQDEPSAEPAVSDSELTLADECSLSELGATLDSCPAVKQEDGTLSAMDANSIGPNSKGTPIECEDELQPMSLVGTTGLAKKGALVTYRCPHPGCSNTFDSRQKLKMHLVFHTEDQRPFKCTMEGCGWSFTTSYKLKRHLQSHNKVRPYRCEWENCGRRFTTIYNLKAHVKAHDQEDAFVCEICSERFRSATRLANHQRTHFEPERPHKCEFPGCEKAFITFSALFSHNRTHFRETGQFTCTYPGCDKRYDKACRLKIHLRSHTGERPFVCDSESCGWTFTSMSKLLRHKRKHEDDRRFTCPEEGCGKSFTRAEHLKGHSITHLGTKPFECPVAGCSAKFSARSSLYIHSKKHRQDGLCLRSRCPVAGCTKHFSSRSSLKSHMLKHHNLSPDVLNQLESTASLTPSCELTSAAQSATAPASVGTELSSLDLSSLFSSVPQGAPPPPTGPAAHPGPAPFTMDMSLVSSGILTIDPASVGPPLGGAKGVDPLILAAGADMGAHVLDAALGPGGGGGVLQQATLQLDDVQTVNPEALGALTALAIQSTPSTEQLQALSSSSTLTAESPSSSLSASLVPSLTSSALGAGAPVPELLSPQPKADIRTGEAAVGPLLSGVEVLTQQENSKGMGQFVFPGHSTSYTGQKEAELPSGTPCPFMESSGSARTDYRAIQLAKRRKQKGPAAGAITSGGTQRKTKGLKGPTAPGTLAGRFGEGTASTTGGLTIRDPVTGAQYVQIQLLQDDPASDGDLAFQLSSQTSSSHSQLTVDLPVNILQEPSAMTEDDNGSDNSQFTGSTINLQDLE